MILAQKPYKSCFKTTTLREKQLRLDYGFLESEKFKPGVRQWRKKAEDRKEWAGIVREAKVRHKKTV
jgi:hypothetical protein